MKRFLTSLGLCALLLTIGLIAFSPTSTADGNLAQKLLDLPAPPPPNPIFRPNRMDRTAAFYDAAKPPSDDAPIDDLMEYWSNQNRVDRSRSYAAKPSDKTLERIMDEISEDPEKAPQYLNLFAGNKDGIDFIKRLYDSELINRKFEKEWRESVKNWLTYNSPFFSNELLRIAETVRDENEYVTNQDELLALAKVDWDKAEPLLNRMVNDGTQPVRQTLARWAYYQHAIDTNDSFDVSKWREQLMKTVEDKTAKPGNRDLAMDAIVRGGDFEGRDEWYMKLLEDETLHDLRVNGQTYTGLTTMINHSPEGKYNERMIELLKSDSKSVRSAAIRNLANGGGIKSEEAVRLMLPWLEDANWANDVANSRRALVSALKEFKIPESVPGLLSLLSDRTLRPKPQRAPVNTNANVAGTDDFRDMQNNYELLAFLGEIVGALGNQRDPRAIPELRAIMPEFESWQRQQVVAAMLACGAFSAYEQVEAVEFTARSQAAAELIMSANTANASAPLPEIAAATNTATRPVNPATIGPEEIKSMLGSTLYQYDNPSEDVVTAMMNRIEALEKKEPGVAAQMRSTLRNWRGITVNAMLARTVKNGKGELPDALKLLARRAEMREKQINDVYDMRGGVPFAVGLGNCLLDQPGEYDAALDGDNVEVKSAMLACARLIRAKLPVQRVAGLLNSPDKTLAAAAEKYLISEDSAEARSYVLARHPNEALILGARASFPGKGETDDSIYEVFGSIAEMDVVGPALGFDEDELNKIEERVRKEVVETPELAGVYAYDNNFVKIYADKVVFSYEEDPARFRERPLDPDEFDRLKGYLAESQVDELVPFLSFCGEYCPDAKELLMVGKAGGRRVFTVGFPKAPFFEQLDAIFKDFRKRPAKLQYYMQKRVPGLEILFEDEQLAALAVWKNGPELRVLTDNRPRREAIDKELKAQSDADEENANLSYEELQERNRKRREQRAYENLAWMRFGNGRPIATAQQPPDFSFIPSRDSLAAQPDQTQWKSRSATLEIRANNEGLYKVVRGQLTRLRPGYFEAPVLTPSGRWVIAKKYGTGEAEDDSDQDPYGPRLVRVNLATGKEFRVDYAQYPPLMPIAFVVGQNKILCGATYGYGGEGFEGEFEGEGPDNDGRITFEKFLWLDPETGTLTETKSNVLPLSQQMFRPLQGVTGKPDEFWAAIPDSEKNQTQIGTYNQRTLTFKALITLPLIEFDSMRMWVDETEAKVYFAYSGHLLSVPLK